MSNLPVMFFQTLAGAQTTLAAGAAAGFYVVAMISMKMWTMTPSTFLASVIIAALLVGTIFEIAALKGERLGMIYVTILGLEVILIAVAAFLFFDEQFSTRELAGCALVLIGAALAWS